MAVPLSDADVCIRQGVGADDACGGTEPGPSVGVWGRGNHRGIAAIKEPMDFLGVAVPWLDGGFGVPYRERWGYKRPRVSDPDEHGTVSARYGGLVWGQVPQDESWGSQG
jgi:hypothetical protein